MMIDRRAFVAGASLIAIPPSLQLLPRQISAHEEEEHRIVFMIDGWRIIQDDSDTSNQVWIRIGHSWRVAWR
jgi:hypothetical protein